MCCLQKVGKLYHETEEDFLLYVAAVIYHIMLKEVKKVRNCSFNLFRNSLFSLSNSPILASSKTCRRKLKIIELTSTIAWNLSAIKLYMLDRGHCIPLYGLRNECAWRYFLQEKDVPTEITLNWIKVSRGSTKPTLVLMLFLNIRRHLSRANVN